MHGYLLGMSIDVYSVGGASMRALEQGLSIRRANKKNITNGAVFWGDGLYDLAQEIDQVGNSRL